ncbi:iron-containing alcohol dehydrogenase, partial [Herbaspirillum sp. B65]|uniref:iron-containing alcohol dehydrogenase n=1 Tax=Herbaspirillum sp. B65 TaxID=137708 RepID=UPI0005C9FAB8
MSSIHYMTSIEFGAGVLQQLEATLASAGIHRPMIVTDTGIVKAGIWEKIAAHLSEEHRQVIYADTPPNPTEEAVEQATALYLAQQCDGMIAIGGGSPLDLAKAVALLATHEAPLSRYAGMAAMPLITANAAPFIAIPTTSGTGSEVGRGALICLRDGQKKAIVSPNLLPRRALCDPDLTEG